MGKSEHRLRQCELVGRDIGTPEHDAAKILRRRGYRSHWRDATQWRRHQAARRFEQAFLNQFVATGGYIYDANQLINTGYRICARFDYVDGNQIAREVFADSSWGDVPNLHEAARWVRVAANTLCPEVWGNPAVRSIY